MGRARARNRLYQTLLWEQRILVAVTLIAVLGILLWVVAVATDHWYHVESDHAIWVNRSQIYFINGQGGLWRICKTTAKNLTDIDSGQEETECQYLKLFPTEQEINSNPELDRSLLDYTRTEMVFSVVSLSLMIMAVGFSFYTFKEPRYMFKRLAGGVHFLSAGAVLVVLEVLINAVRYEEQYVTSRFPRGSKWQYGYSFVLAWCTFSVFIVAGCCFIICSRKRKGRNAPTEWHAQADQPNILGR